MADAHAHPTQDEFYHRYLTKNNLFEPVMAAFQANGNRYNLLNSAVIEMVDFIRRENIKSLVAHLMEHFGEMFQSVDYVQVRACSRHFVLASCKESRERWETASTAGVILPSWHSP